MTIADRLRFDPTLPWPALAGLALFCGLLLAVYVWRKGRAPLLRGLGLTLVLIGLAQPIIVTETREPSTDIAAVVIDRSESVALAGRSEATSRAAEQTLARLREDPTLEVRVREVQSGPDGTPAFAAIEEALADAPSERIAGVVVITDGQASDPPEDLDTLEALGPIHALVVGDPNRGDRRLTLLAAPEFAIVGEPLVIEGVVEDPVEGAEVSVRVSVDGALVRRTRVRAGQPFSLQISLERRGQAMVVVEAEEGPQEISLLNNRVAFPATGVRDRLRVLLITGEPHPGARVWRNFLKSDPSVDLVHFTILRPTEKSDATLPEELALIAFPHRELFDEKLDQFDLIIFDRYRRRGILEYSYFENIARRVEAGGALLVAAGPYDAGVESLNRTPLAAILPSQPLYRLKEEPFRPAPTRVGGRHPVLRGLPDPATWGRWNRAVEADASGGQTLLSGAGGPLLVLDRAGKGRVAQLWSDQIWLWARGHDGGGPHAQLLRRLAHWLMQEPELEEERLTLQARTDGVWVERTTIGAAPDAAVVVDPGGGERSVALEEVSPGVWRGRAESGPPGLYEARSGALKAFAALGPLNPKEAAALEATTEVMGPAARATGGQALTIGEDAGDLPEIRRVSGAERAYGPGWIGLRRNDAFTVRASEARPFGPGLAWASLGLLLLMAAWRREAR